MVTLWKGLCAEITEVECFWVVAESADGTSEVGLPWHSYFIVKTLVSAKLRICTAGKEMWPKSIRFCSSPHQVQSHFEDALKESRLLAAHGWVWIWSLQNLGCCLTLEQLLHLHEGCSTKQKYNRIWLTFYCSGPRVHHKMREDLWWNPGPRPSSIPTSCAIDTACMNMAGCASSWTTVRVEISRKLSSLPRGLEYEPGIELWLHGTYKTLNMKMIMI